LWQDWHFWATIIPVWTLAAGSTVPQSGGASGAAAASPAAGAACTAMT
jgi:hypothetical protein